MNNFIRSTVLGGVVFLVPVIALLVVIAKALQLISKVAAPLANALGLQSVAGMAAAELLSVILLVLVCFLAGLAAKTSRARNFVQSLEDNILEKIPTYQLLKTKAQSALDLENSKDLQAVRVRFDDAWQLAFEMQRIEGDEVVVFLPGSPDPWSGSLCVVAADRVTKLDMPVKTAVNLMKRLGRGSAEVLPGQEIGAPA